jgi:hypothetical protein
MASDADMRDHNVVRVLRGLIVVTCLLGMLAVMLDRHYAAFIGTLLVPAGWVYWRPRWAQLVTWSMWLVPPVMTGVIMHIDRTEQLWTPSGFLTFAIVVLVIVVMPLVRLRSRGVRQQRSNLPEARVVR